MPTLDMRPRAVSETSADTEEVKQPVVETGGDESTPEETSNLEEKTEGAESSNEEATSEKTIDETAPAAVTEVLKPETKEPWNVDALKAEREKVLADLRELRRERRQARAEASKEPELFVQKDDELSDVAEQDVQLIERVLKAKGYVKKEDVQGMSHQLSYKEKLDSAKDKWLDAHPEYLPENDPDDSKWNALNRTMEEYGFKAPPRPQQIQDLLDFAHNKINPGKTIPLKTKASIDAAKEKIVSPSKGSTTGTTRVSNPSKGRIADTSFLVGFTEEELRELNS